MTTDKDAQAPMPDPTGSDGPGESPFAPGLSPFAVRENRTILGKLGLGLSILPWAAIGLAIAFQPG